MNRRNFMSLVAAGSAAAVKGAPAEYAVPVKTPRATSGDPVEPSWDERLTITVGPSKADLVGSNEKVIQAAVDSMARWGGGTVKILPGIYRFRNSVFLQSKIRILGSGLDSVLIKEPSLDAKLTQDSDWFDQEITFANPNGLQIGDGICLRAKNTSTGGPEVIKRTLVARSGNRFKLDRALRENVWLKGEPAVSSLFPLFSGENIQDVAIENIALDGNKANNGNLDGNYAGCIWMQDCNRITMRRVTARNFNGDGISWQICHDVSVEDCHSHDHAGLRPAPWLGLAALGHPQQPADRQRSRLVLLLGREVGTGREELHRRQPQVRRLDRTPRHRQHRPRQRYSSRAAKWASCSGRSERLPSRATGTASKEIESSA